MPLTLISPAATRLDLLYIDNSNAGVDATKRRLKTGSGNPLPVLASLTRMEFDDFVLQSSLATAVSAAGSSQSDAQAIAKQYNRVTTAAAGQGVKLPTGEAGMLVTVANDGANTLKVYPVASSSIDSLSANAAVLLPVGWRAKFYALTATLWLSFTARANTTDLECLMIAVTDEITALTTGTAKVTFRMPFAFTLTAVRASLSTASSSGLPAVDVNEAGVSIFSTTLTIDANEKTSTTAATPAVVTDTSLADDAEITIDIDAAGTGAKGLKLYLIGRQTQT
jgi:hypothetical protein